MSTPSLPRLRHHTVDLSYKEPLRSFKSLASAMGLKPRCRLAHQTFNDRQSSACLTLRSSRLAPAWHLAREAASLILGLAGQAPHLRSRLSSNVRRHKQSRGHNTPSAFRCRALSATETGYVTAHDHKPCLWRSKARMSIEAMPHLQKNHGAEWQVQSSPPGPRKSSLRVEVSGLKREMQSNAWDNLMTSSGARQCRPLHTRGDGNRNVGSLVA